MIKYIAQIQAAAADKSGSVDTYIKEILLQLKDAFHRIDVLENDTAWHGKIFLAVVAVLAWFGWAEFKRMREAAAAAVESQIKEKFDAAHKEAQVLLAKANEQIAELERRAGTKIYMESGWEDFKLKGNYISAWIRFKTKFPRVPQVFVTEAKAGHWIYMKVDNTDIDRFQWAGSSLISAREGEEHAHEGRIQWVAILTEEVQTPAPVTAPPPPDEVPAAAAAATST